jgi:spore coat polysaccharide biosynthesis protein SpsF
MENQQYDIVTNCKVRTFPHGLDVELYSFNSLEKMWREIKQPEIREWFPFFVEKNPSLFKVLNIENDQNLSNMRWTVDYPEDFELVKNIYQSLFKENQVFTTKDVLNLLDKNPKLAEINSKYAGHHNVGAPSI